MAEEIITTSKQSEQLSEETKEALRKMEAEARAQCGLPAERPQEAHMPKQSKQVKQEVIAQAKSFAEVAADFLAFEIEEAKETGRLGYMARAMVQATLPHSDPKSPVYARKNGNFTLSILANPYVGLPYGPIPRLLLSWLTGEAVRVKNRTVTLGDSLSAFMRQLGFEARPSGGAKGSMTAVRKQMKRLFSSSVSCAYSDEQRDAGIMINVVEKYEVWWTPKDPEQRSLWESTVTLSQPFFNEITSNPVPIRMDTLAYLKGSSLALDIYCWLTYRNFYAKRESRIPWEALQAQFGAGYPTTTQGKLNFKKKFLLALRKVAESYPEALKLRVEPDVLVYVPGMPDVAPILPSGS